MGWIIGIDDAGRGPVLGPMVLAGVLMDENEEVEVKALGAKDSKLLDPEKRKIIGDKITKRFEYHTEVTTPKEIDNSNNLNYLEAIKAAMIINTLVEKAEGSVRVIIDCPSVNIQNWTLDVQKLIKKPEKVSLICEHKADVNHAVVSAASIVAKEKREEEIFKLKFKFGEDFGSGYPADPKTKEFLKNNFDNKKYKDLIRFSWKTVKKLQDDVGQGKLF
ncbi:MAG: ribonuclease HII [archaeon]|nr:ribonuclease HII [archaeon]MCR4323753.1 ribonuclease HII [Nanoarchaeota archaeon]